MIEKETNIFGLTKELVYENVAMNCEDWISCEHDYLHEEIEHEFSDKNKSVLQNLINELEKSKFNSVLEIGIARSNEHSSTYYLLNKKLDETVYIGVDTNPECVDRINNWNKPNTHALNCDSGNFDEINDYLKTLNITELDLFIIDGFHSIDQVYKDFKLASLVRKGGYVLFHDTNYHPGPVTILNCINTELFSIQKYFENEKDWGVAVLKRK